MSNLNCFKKCKVNWIANELNKLNEKLNYILNEYNAVIASNYSELFAEFIKNDLQCNNNDDVGCLIRLLAYKNMLIAKVNLEIAFYLSLQ